jgi:CheY-like chemotaxis protein
MLQFITLLQPGTAGMLPGLDGFELRKRLRAESTTKAILVIVLTGKGTTKNAGWVSLEKR